LLLSIFNIQYDSSSSSSSTRHENTNKILLCFLPPRYVYGSKIPIPDPSKRLRTSINVVRCFFTPYEKGKLEPQTREPCSNILNSLIEISVHPNRFEADLKTCRIAIKPFWIRLNFGLLGLQLIKIEISTLSSKWLRGRRGT
jgi:hypothetical protein